MHSDQSNHSSFNKAESYNNTIEDQLVSWISIVACSDRLLQLAYQKNWQSLLDLHAHRDVLLENFFNQEIEKDIVENIRIDIVAIQRRDEEIVRLVKNNQQQLGGESQQLQAMKKRISSYLSAEGK
jgi:succinate dehydrogenase flavin-adding protein (antitoxin of CptAB toxin-antitoxin module)